MFTTRVLISVTLLVPLILAAGCASTPSEQAAAKDCKVVVADFPGRPSKTVQPVEQAAAELRVSRLASARGYATSPNLFADVSRDCY